MIRNANKRILLISIIFVIVLAACGGQASGTNPKEVSEAQGSKLSVVATTTIVGDVVGTIGGDIIDLQVLMTPDTDPHSFEPSPLDLTALETADVVFINGLGLEEFLGEMVEGIAGSEKIVSLSENVETIAFEAGHEHDHEGEEHEGEEHEGEEHDHEGEEHEGEGHAHEGEEHEGEEHAHEGEEHEGEEHAHEGEEHEGEEHTHHHGGIDPHVWMDPNNIVVWADSVAAQLSELDPDNGDAYLSNAEAYKHELSELDSWIVEQVENVSPDNRKLVTDHQAFGYFSNRYGFEMVGAVIPGTSTLAEPSAQELAELEDAIRATGAKAVFVGLSVNPALSERVANDTGISLVPLYTGALSAEDGPASTYIQMLRYNVNAIVDALQ